MANNEINYKINIAAELAGLRAMEDRLQRNVAQLKALGQTGSDGFKAMERDLSSLQKAIASKGIGGRLSAEFQGMLQNVPVLGRAFSAINGAAGAGTATLGSFAAAALAAKKALAAWADEEKSIVSVNAALAATEQLSPTAAANLRDLAGALQRATNIDDSAWMESFSTLIRLSGVSASEMERHATTVQGLAGLIGGDLSTATMLYTRALNGHFDMLGKCGIALDENASKQEKLAALQEKAAGATGLVAAQVDTVSGAWVGFKNSILDAGKVVGEFLAKGWHLKEVLQSWANALQSILPKRIDPDTSGLKNIENTAKTVADRLRELGLASDQLPDFGAAAAGNAANSFEKLNNKLKAKLDLDRALASAKTQKQLADLSLSETEQLSRPGLTKEDKNMIRADFVRHRAVVKAAGEEQDLALQRKAAADQLATVKQAREEKAVGVFQAEKDVADRSHERAIARQEEIAAKQQGSESDVTRKREKREGADARLKTAADVLKGAKSGLASYDPFVTELEDKLRVLDAKILAAKQEGKAFVAAADLAAKEAATPEDLAKTEKTKPGRGPAPFILSSWQRMGALGGLLPGAAADPARRSADALDEIKKQLAKGVNVLNQPKTTGAVAQ